MKRVLRVLTVVIFIFGILAFLGLKYLSSQRLAAQVAARLGKLYGGRVQVTGASVGLGKSTLTGIQLFEASGSDTPWASVETLSADVTLLDALSGNVSPSEVSLAGVAISLQFDKEGRLVTRLPPLPSAAGNANSIPDLRIEHGRINLQKEGLAPIVLSGVEATVTRTEQGLALEGRIDDTDTPTWGRWLLHGRWNRQSSAISVKFNTDTDLIVSRSMLDELAFVPSSVGKAVHIQGATSIWVTLDFAVAERTGHYRVDLEPRGMEVQIPAITLEATAVEGKVLVEDGLVRLYNVRGRAFDGHIATDAELDFRTAPGRLKFSRVDVKDLNVRLMPANWGLPRQIDGRLKGTARLEIALGDKPQTQGEGRGEIEDARIGGQPTSEPVRLELHAEGGGYRFHSPQRESRRQDGPEEKVQDAMAVSEPSKVFATVPTPLPAALVNGVTAAIKDVVERLAAAGTDGVTWLADKLSFAEAQVAGPRYVEVSLQMRDVDLGRFVLGLGIKPPFALAGRLSYDVRASIPLDTPTDAKTYRVSGSADIKQLRLGELDVDDLRSSIEYSAGTLRLHDLIGHIRGAPVSGEPVPGALRGKARVQLFPLGELVADVTLDALPLSKIADLTGTTGRLSGALSGTVAARVSAARLERPDAWQATASVRSARFEAFDMTGDAGFAEAHLHDGLLSVTGLRAQVGGTAITGSSDLRLTNPYHYDARLEVRDLELVALHRLFPAVVPVIPVEGPFSTAFTMEGTLQPLSVVSANLNLQAERVRLQGIPAQKVQGAITYSARFADYHFEGDTLGGRLDLNGQVPLTGTVPGKEGRLSVRRARLARINEVFGVRPEAFPLRGTADLEIKFRHQRPDGTPVGSGWVTLTRPRWGDFEIAESLRGDLILGQQNLRLRDISASVGEGQLSSQLSLNLQRLERSWFTLNLEGVDASTIFRSWPGLGGKIEGSMDAHMRGRLGGEWSGTGEVILTRGRVLGVDVADWRLPLTWNLAPREGRGEIVVRETTAHLASGRAAGRASAAWGSGVRVDGQIRFFNVELRPLLRQLADATSLGSGRLSGQVDFEGRNIHSSDDLTAAVSATMMQTQAFEFPVLREIAPFLGIQTSSAFERGELRANVARGVLRLQKLELERSALHVSIAGNIALAGRLDLDVAATAGPANLDAARLPFTRVRFPLAFPLLRLRVTGAARAPTIRVQPW